MITNHRPIFLMQLFAFNDHEYVWLHRQYLQAWYKVQHLGQIGVISDSSTSNLRSVLNSSGASPRPCSEHVHLSFSMLRRSSSHWLALTVILTLFPKSMSRDVSDVQGPRAVNIASMLLSRLLPQAPRFINLNFARFGRLM